MHFIYLGSIVVCLFLMGCEKSQNEMEEIEKMVLIEDEDVLEWSLPEERAVANGESPSQEGVFLEGIHEEVK